MPRHQQTGRGLILTVAVWLGAAALVVGYAVFLTHPIRVPPGDDPRPCSRNLKQLALGMLMYVQDYDDKMPLAETWADGLFPYIKNLAVYRCPSVEHPPAWAGADYAFNSTLAGRHMDEFASYGEEAPALFESSTGLAKDGSWNVSDPLTSFIPRHEGKGHIAYADGHVKAVESAPDAHAGMLVRERR